MNKNHDPQLRVLYILLIPIVLLIIILNTGFLQKTLPAARVHGRSYTVVRYNYYYFDYYNTFLEENELRLDELGYDPTVSDSTQYTADGTTWKDYFIRQAEANMAETAYYLDLAEAAGYVFTENDLMPIAEKLDANAAVMASNYLSAQNFYTAFYGQGMTEAIYTAELTRAVKAQAYKQYLIRQSEPTEADIAACIAASGIPDYRTANLRVITLEPVPDRETGLVGQEQWDALGLKLSRLEARYGAGESFEALQTAFSTCALGDRSGVLTDATRLDLPDGLAAALLFGADAAERPAGSTITGVDEDAGYAYFVILDGWGGSGPEREAALTLGSEALQAEQQAAIDAGYTVTRLRIGMLLATV